MGPHAPEHLIVALDESCEPVALSLNRDRLSARGEALGFVAVKRNPLAYSPGKTLGRYNL
jgi:hypothetical protein